MTNQKDDGKIVEGAPVEFGESTAKPDRLEDKLQEREQPNSQVAQSAKKGISIDKVLKNVTVSEYLDLRGNLHYPKHNDYKLVGVHAFGSMEDSPKTPNEDVAPVAHLAENAPSNAEVVVNYDVKFVAQHERFHDRGKIYYEASGVAIVWEK